MGMIIQPIPVNVLDQVRRKEVAVLDLDCVKVHIFGDYGNAGDIIIRVYDGGKPSAEYRARDETQAREIIGRVVLEHTQLWQIAS